MEGRGRRVWFLSIAAVEFWTDTLSSILIEHGAEIVEPDVASVQADVFFEALQLQPMSIELSFMRTDRVNVDEK